VHLLSKFWFYAILGLCSILGGLATVLLKSVVLGAVLCGFGVVLLGWGGISQRTGYTILDLLFKVLPDTPIFAVMRQTIKASVRSKVFIILVVFILLTVFGLPLLLKGDGTATGQLQVILTYSLSLIILLISATTLWLGCAVISHEVESYRLHMVVTKPIAPWKIWLGKWLGVFFMNVTVFMFGAVVIGCMIWYRVNYGEFNNNKAELKRLESEVLVARRVFKKDPINWKEQLEVVYNRLLKEKRLPEKHNEVAVKAELLKQLRASEETVSYHNIKYWRFSNLKKIADDEDLIFRYRFYYSGTTQYQQRMVYAAWSLLKIDGETSQWHPLDLDKNGQLHLIQSGVFHEIKLKGSDIIVDKNGNRCVVISFAHLDKRGKDNKPAPFIFKQGDGPVILEKVSGFWFNYCRSMLLVIFLLAFLSALGCTVGAAFSTPVAIFVGVSYLIIGIVCHGIILDAPKDDLGNVHYVSVNEKLALGLSYAMSSVKDFDTTADLINGRVVKNKKIVKSLIIQVILRGGIVALLGMMVLSKRELGMVVRK